MATILKLLWLVINPQRALPLSAYRATCRFLHIQFDQHFNNFSLYADIVLKENSQHVIYRADIYSLQRIPTSARLYRKLECRLIKLNRPASLNLNLLCNLLHTSVATVDLIGIREMTGQRLCWYSEKLVLSHSTKTKDNKLHQFPFVTTDSQSFLRIGFIAHMEAEF